MLSSWRMPSRHVLSRQWRFVKPFVKAGPRFSPFVQKPASVLRDQTARSYIQFSIMRLLSLELQRVASVKKLASLKPKRTQKHPLDPQLRSWLKENKELLDHFHAAYRINHNDPGSWPQFKEQFTRVTPGERVSMKLSGNEAFLGGKHFNHIFQYNRLRGKSIGRGASLCKKAKPASLKNGKFVLKAPRTVFDGSEKSVLLVHVSPSGIVFEGFELTERRGNKYDQSVMRFGSREFVAFIQKKDLSTVAKKKVRS
ncbi:hypothetical protein CkaCkLH20_09248 [Colletotrichum karsti]|uniref:Uncharacterized protein n=1 Tax=Colletotrichum karsti TaxID=1095194 RepID=A0A9P6LI94_9PEZI|nr:uncharacterized protein CkaCkLH20_09248 [Colletotrichum karsti]KAF9873435.1 hypothetical protein CkaCkLH20_09248 [Colletotrichum karsti]